MRQDLLLTTKLYIPREPPDLVSRPRLTRLLGEGMRRKLTLVSAPAGFGKTTLLSEWIHQNTSPAAWVSLDEHDNDPKQFLCYLIAALQTIQEGIAQEVLDWLQTPQLPDQAGEMPGDGDWLQAALTSLVNEIATFPSSFALILDDYHVIESQQIHDALSLFLDYMPPQMHLMIASRADPPLPLPRLRVRRQLIEIREAELRFTSEEATTFLNQVMRLGLSTEDVSALEARTEGWIASLQLAALAMQPLTFQSDASSMEGQPDVHSFIRAFTGSHRYILDYLADEVLMRQPEHIRSFLFLKRFL